MDASKLPKLQSREKPSDGRPINLPGVYVHKDLGADKPFITSDDFDTGVAQADFLMNPIWKDAWSRVGDVPSRQEILKQQKLQAAKDAKAEGSAKIKAELLAFAGDEKATKPEVAVPAPGTGTNY